MPTLEERVAYLEGQVSDQSQTMLEVREAIRHLEHKMDARFETVDRRVDAGFEAVDRRFEAVDRRFDAMDRHVETLEGKLSSQFVWIIGIQVTTLVTMVAALTAALLARNS